MTPGGRGPFAVRDRRGNPSTMKMNSPSGHSSPMPPPKAAAETTRRHFLTTVAGTALATGLPAPLEAKTSTQASPNPKSKNTTKLMNTLTPKDGTTIFYKDLGPKDGPVVTFSHGWPLCSDAWDPQIFHLASQGFRCIAHDRRGHGRSGESWDGNNMDQYADDLAELFEKLDLKKAIMVGHSTGGGEIARFIGRHGTKRVSKVVLVGAVPPIMLKTVAYPDGLPMEVFDGLRKDYLANRAQFFLEFAGGPFFGFNRPDAKPSPGLVQSWFIQGMMSGYKSAYDCIKAFSETDFTEDLKKIDVPTLIVHGSDDQIVPIKNSALLSAKLVKNSKLLIYDGGSHAIGDTSKDRFNADLLAFAKS